MALNLHDIEDNDGGKDNGKKETERVEDKPSLDDRSLPGYETCWMGPQVRTIKEH